MDRLSQAVEAELTARCFSGMISHDEEPKTEIMTFADLLVKRDDMEG